jgi:hypothetical protein
MLHVSSPDKLLAGLPLLEPVKLQVPLAKLTAEPVMWPPWNVAPANDTEVVPLGPVHD